MHREQGFGKSQSILFRHALTTGWQYFSYKQWKEATEAVRNQLPVAVNNFLRRDQWYSYLSGARIDLENWN